MQIREIDGYDVVVAGGGPGGLAAAVAAARAGAKTILLEREGCLGGGMTTMMVCPFMPHVHGSSEEPGSDPMLISAGLFREVCQRMYSRGQATPSRCIAFDDEYMKIVLDEVACEAGVKVVFHAALFDAEASDGRVTAARFAHNGGPIRVTGKVFIDGTGDALLAEAAGAEVQFGDKDGRVMPMTTKFIVGGVDFSRAPDGHEMRKRCAAGAKDNPPLVNLNFSTFALKPDKGWVHFNAIRVAGRNTIDPFGLSEAEAEGRRRVENFILWLRANVPGYEKCHLVKTGAHIGVRESRRVVGDYELTYEDWKGARFDDAVCCCSYSIDIHGDTQNVTRIEHCKPGQYYQIPYRCLTPRGMDNLLVASRSISSSVEVHSSLRIMPVVMNVGEAAGIAAAMSLPAADVRKIDIRQLQKAIRDGGGILEPRTTKEF